MVQRYAAATFPGFSEAAFSDLGKSLPEWHGWHAFRRGLATNLHDLGIPDKEIQAILRHGNISITQNIYIKSVSKSQVAAMDTLSENFGTCNDLATEEGEQEEPKPQTRVIQ